MDGAVHVPAGVVVAGLEEGELLEVRRIVRQGPGVEVLAEQPVR